MRLEHDIVIDRPVAPVFAFVSDPRNLPSWHPSVVEVRCEGTPTAGSRFTEVRHFAGKRFETVVEVIELEPDALLAIRIVNGPVPVTITHRFASEPDGTRVTIAAEATPKGLARFAAGAIAKVAEQEGVASLRRLKALLESTAPG